MVKSDFELTKYEEARIIGARALQLASGAPPLIDVDKLRKSLAVSYISAVDLAKHEFQAGIIPMHVVRKAEHQN